jgi:RNA-binding protein
MITKIETVPKIGETIVDENLKPVGKVFDIIGPVSSPYATIKPSISKPEKLTNQIVYVISSRGERRESNGGRRRIQ